jgi:hypothetical protein
VSHRRPRCGSVIRRRCPFSGLLNAECDGMARTRNPCLGCFRQAVLMIHCYPRRHAGQAGRDRQHDQRLDRLRQCRSCRTSVCCDASLIAQVDTRTGNGGGWRRGAVNTGEHLSDGRASMCECRALRQRRL